MKSWGDIKNRCPKLFKNGCIFECGLGWYSILENLCLNIEKILEKTSKQKAISKDEEVFEFEMFINQIKEKYWTLRFYMNVSTREIDNLIDKAQEESRYICEMCGKEGKLSTKAWYQVRCKTCEDK